MFDGAFTHDIVKAPLPFDDAIGMLHNSLPFTVNLLVLSDPLLIGFDQICMFCTLDQPSRFVFGTALKKAAVQACFCFVMLYPVDGFAMIFEIPAPIRSQGFSCRTKVLINCLVVVNLATSKATSGACKATSGIATMTCTPCRSAYRNSVPVWYPLS